MHRRKTVVVIAIVAALTLAIAGSAYAATTGATQGGQSTQAGSGLTFQGGNTPSPSTTCTGCTDCAGPIQQRDRDQNTSGEDCDGTCDQVQEQAQTQSTTTSSPLKIQNRAATQTGQVDGAVVQTRARVAERVGTVEQTQVINASGAQTQNQDRTGECDGTCDQTQERVQDGTCDREGTNAPGAGAGSGSGGGNGPGNGPGNGDGSGDGVCDGAGPTR